MQRRRLCQISLSMLLLFVLAPRRLCQDRQSEATGSPAVAICTPDLPATTVGNNPLPRILNPSRETSDGYEERLVRLGRYREAVEAYKKTAEVEPHDAVLHNNLCVAYLQLGHYEEGVIACSQALQMKPRFADAYSNLAMALSLLGKHRKAVEAYRRAIQINPQFAEAHNNLGVAYNRLGKQRKAIRTFRESIRIKPDFAEAHYNLASAYLALGDQKAALAEHEVLNSLDPSLAKILVEAILDSYKFTVPLDRTGARESWFPDR
jgi:tetratricopeptide (TPR) repeat protein